MSSDPFAIVRSFEMALCEYTGAKYAVTTTSCTMAILIAAAWFRSNVGEGDWRLSMPKLSYVGVAASLRNAGYRPIFREEDWQGEYQFQPLPFYDSARRFTSAMHHSGTMQCVSFHWGKILGLSQGGAILHDDKRADAWMRRARFDGRTEGAEPRTDQVQYPSWHAYMAPETAAHGLMKLSVLPKHNADLLRSDYPDLSKLEAFK